jgi:hypothetical protein
MDKVLGLDFVIVQTERFLPFLWIPTAGNQRNEKRTSERTLQHSLSNFFLDDNFSPVSVKVHTFISTIQQVTSHMIFCFHIHLL